MMRIAEEDCKVTCLCCADRDRRAPVQPAIDPHEADAFLHRRRSDAILRENELTEDAAPGRRVDGLVAIVLQVREDGGDLLRLPWNIRPVEQFPDIGPRLRNDVRSSKLRRRWVWR